MWAWPYGVALNRYAYVANNPLKFTDPSGHGWFSNLWKKVRGWIGTIVTVCLICLSVPYPIASVIGSAVGTIVNGGTFKSFVIGAGIGIAAGYIANALGGVLGSPGLAAAVEAGTATTGQSVLFGTLAGMAAGAISSCIYGGNFGKAMLEGTIVGGITAWATYGARRYATRQKFIAQVKQIEQPNFKPSTYNAWLGSSMDLADYPDYPLPADPSEMGKSWSCNWSLEDLSEFANGWLDNSITRIGAEQWNNFVGGVRQQVVGMSQFNPFNAIWADTSYDNDQSLYWVAPLNKVSRGYEINYIAQGMLYNHSLVYNVLTRETLPYAWKGFKMVFDSNKFYRLPWSDSTREPYAPVTNDEMYFTRYGFAHFKE